MMENVAENVAKIFPIAKEKGIKLGIENVPSHQVFSRPEEFNKLLDMIYKKLEEKGIPRKEAEKWLGVTFDTAHAATLQGIMYQGRTYGPPSEFLKGIKAPIVHLHAVDTIGRFDAHLPVGQGDVDWERVNEVLKERGFTGTAVYELSPYFGETGVLYAASLREAYPSMYEIGGAPTTTIGAPGYLAASFADPLFFTPQERRYFYSSWLDLF